MMYLSILPSVVMLVVLLGQPPMAPIVMMHAVHHPSMLYVSYAVYLAAMIEETTNVHWHHQAIVHESNITSSPIHLANLLGHIHIDAFIWYGVADEEKQHLERVPIVMQMRTMHVQYRVIIMMIMQMMQCYHHDQLHDWLPLVYPIHVLVAMHMIRHSLIWLISTIDRTV